MVITDNLLLTTNFCNFLLYRRNVQISLLSSAINPIENCPESGAVFDPYKKTHLTGEDTPDKYPLGDWQNRFDSNS